MTKSIPWIWFAVLLIGLGMLLLGCGEPSQAGGEPAPGNAERPSPAEVDRTLTAGSTNPPSSEQTSEQPSPPTSAPEAIPSAQETTEHEAALDAGNSRAAATPTATEPTGKAQQIEVEDDVTLPNQKIPTDRFRTIAVDSPPRETYREVALLVPAGTRLGVEFLDALSSQTSEIGDRFRVRVVETVTVDGYFAIPAGSEIGGEVTDVRRLRKIGGQARLALAFDRLGVASGAELPMRASLFDEGRDETRRDAAIIGGTAVAGAIVGREVKDRKRRKGGLVGAVIGAAVGAGIAAATEGEAITIGVGTRADLILENDLALTVRVRVLESSGSAIRGD